MKKAILRKLFCGLLCSLVYWSGFAQSFTLKQDRITLAALMDSISTKTSVKIAYDVNAMPIDSVISIDVQQIHPYELVKSLLKDKDLRVSFNNSQIVIGKAISKLHRDNYFRVTGIVVDKDEQFTLPMVNITIKNKALGTITNTDGEFEFVLPLKYANDTIVFSYLGYEAYDIPIVEVDSSLHVELISHDYRLPEIQVKYQDVDKILDNLIRRKDENYFKEQNLLTGFFRESIKQDGEYVQVSEAIIEILKPGYHNVFNLERVKFIKGRKLSGLPSMDQINFKLEGGPYQFSRIDIARYLDFIPKEENGVIYKYTYDGVEYLNGEMVYKVGFSPIDDTGNLLYKGQLFVHSVSYALVHVDFELTKRSLKFSRKALIKKSSRRIKAKPKKAKYYIDYRLFNGRWILNKIGGELVVHINDKDQKIDSEFTGISELLISDCKMDTEEKFKWAELFKPDYVLSEEIKETDEEFWENYNIIKPEEELERVFKTHED